MTEKLFAGEIENEKNRILHVVVFTVLWYVFAHGYRMANNLFSHDSLLEVCQDDSAWQIALGRWAQPFLIFLRGGLTNPWLIGILTIFYLCMAICLLTELLQLKKGVVLFLLSGVIVVNPSVICTNAAFLQWLDFYGMALLLAVAGVYLCSKEKWWCIAIGILSMTGSMAIYQAYICVSIVLFMMLLLKLSSEDKEFKLLFHKVVLYCGSLVLAAVIYYLVWKVFLSLFGIWTADTYNGLASVGQYSINMLPSLICFAYKKVWEYFWNPAVFTTMEFRSRTLSIIWIYAMRGLNIGLVAVTIGVIIKRIIVSSREWWRVIGQLLILLLLPLGMNFVCLMSKGMEHTLMIFAFNFLYVFGLWMMEQQTAKNRIVRVVVVAATGCFVWINVVYANQVYLKKSLQEKAMTSMMTRIVDRMEQIENYEPGVTPVAFSGYFENSPYINQLQNFEEIIPYGMGKTTLTYMGTDYAFLKYELNVPVNESRVSGNMPEVMNMPCFPKDGSVAFVGDTLVVKISE